MRVFFTGGGTGGHLYPALAIARALVRQVPEVRPFFIGARRGIERDVLPESGFPHALLDLEPLYRSNPLRNWRTARGLVAGRRSVASLAESDRPKLVVATGGYASGATLAWAAGARIPFVLQDQNSFPGRTVRFFSRFAREIYLGFPEAITRLPARARGRAVDTGNPIEPPPPAAQRPRREEARREFGFGDDVELVILASGGSQGSAALNALVASWVSGGVPAGVGLIWATGRAHHGTYTSFASSQVFVSAYLAPIARAYAAADIAVSRAGAMTTAELCAWGLPMLLIPLPTAAADHQTANARALAAAGAAEWVPEREANASDLAAFVSRLSDQRLRAQRSEATLARARPYAAEEIAGRLGRLLGATK
ncbi:MAG: UDP-N-acetylglucosamine--N-acetylmuramyl-(pentapeptide) pyrophosphoryl-undecaprenol N-acetylglucosamine transferase [Gemmatimonadota bacterium]